MKVRFSTTTLFGVLALGTVSISLGCSNDAPVTRPETPGGISTSSFGTQGLSAGPVDYGAELSGSQVVPPVETEATGDAWVRPALNGFEMDYVFWVYDAAGVTAAHVRLGKPGENGPVVALLYGGPPVDDASEWTHAGSLTQDDLTGPLAGKSIYDLLWEIKKGNAYVIVNTAEHPEGEIRGLVYLRRGTSGGGGGDAGHHPPVGGVWRPGSGDDHDGHQGNDPWGGLPPLRRP